jgi:nucleoid-associated protein YgaU
MFVRLLIALVVVLLVWAVAVHSSSGSAGERSYVVRPYDTLWSIAVEHYGGDPREAIWRLRHRNRLEGTLIRPGQRLILP